MRVACGIILLMALAGCGTALNPDSGSASRARLTSFTDRACREVARQRADDAAMNGYDGTIQVRIARDNYGQCLVLNRAATSAP